MYVIIFYLLYGCFGKCWSVLLVTLVVLLQHCSCVCLCGLKVEHFNCLGMEGGLG
jgi:hypothetical protein